MSQYNSEDTLKSLFPVVIVLVVLVAGIIIMPTLTADPRSRASETKPTPTTQTTKITPTPTQDLEIVCAELYSPVCDPRTNTTYPNDCEANLAGAKNTTGGECLTTAPVVIPSTN